MCGHHFLVRDTARKAAQNDIITRHDAGVGRLALRAGEVVNGGKIHALTLSANRDDPGVDDLQTCALGGGAFTGRGKGQFQGVGHDLPQPPDLDHNLLNMRCPVLLADGDRLFNDLNRDGHFVHDSVAPHGSGLQLLIHKGQDRRFSFVEGFDNRGAQRISEVHIQRMNRYQVCPRQSVTQSLGQRQQ